MEESWNRGQEILVLSHFKKKKLFDLDKITEILFFAYKDIELVEFTYIDIYKTKKSSLKSSIEIYSLLCVKYIVRSCCITQGAQPGAL